MSGPPYWLGVGGAWVQLDGIDLGIGYTIDRPRSETVSVGGVRRTQRARRAPRTWSLSLSSCTVEAIHWLSLAASGVMADIGDVWLYDSAAAQFNMLDPRHTIGDFAQPKIRVAGAGSPLLPVLAPDYAFTQVLRGGVEYTLSFTTNHSAGVTIGSYDVGAGTVGIVAVNGTGTRRSTVTFTPPVDVVGVFAFAQSFYDEGVTGVRLTEGDLGAEFPFVEGRSTPCRVSVEDPSQSLQFVQDDRLPLADYTVTLREVGS